VKKIWPILALLLSGLTSTSAPAQEWPIYGTRALAMGGTAVAVSSDASASFANPAAFAFEPFWDLTFPLVTLTGDIHGAILASADAIQIDFDRSSLSATQSALDDGTVSQKQRADALDAFLFRIPRLGEPGQGVAVRATTGPAFRYKNWGISISAFGYGGISPVFDYSSGLSLGAGGFAAAVPATPNGCGSDVVCQNFAATLVTASGGALTSAQAEQLVFDAGIPRIEKDGRARKILEEMVRQTAAGGTTLAANRSGVSTRAILVEQIAFTYSRRVVGDTLAAGVSLKEMQGETYQTSFTAHDLEGGNELHDQVTGRDSRKASTRLGLDAGLLYRPVHGLRIGLEGMNLNAPEFDFSGGQGTLRLDPRVRAGVGWNPNRWVTIGADLDLSEVDSHVVQGLKYRYGNAGAEFLVWKILALRGGLYKNLAANGGALVYTGGVGFLIGSFEIALSGAISTEEQALKSNRSGGETSTIPSGGGFAIAFNWKSRR